MSSEAPPPLSSLFSLCSHPSCLCSRSRCTPFLGLLRLSRRILRGSPEADSSFQWRGGETLGGTVVVGIGF